MEHSKRNLILEIIAVACILSALLYTLIHKYSIMAWSDPIHWYSFGISFMGSFGNSHLAYGFPFLIGMANMLVGVYYAFLVNIPVLVFLILAFYLFARLIEQNNRFAPFHLLLTPFFSLFLIILLNRDMFIYLVNPYRDPTSFLFMLIGISAVIRFTKKACYSWIWMIVAGFSFAFSISCRETNALILPPIAIYILAAKYQKRSMSFWIPGVILCITLFVGMIPWLIQNQMVSGNLVVPSQAVSKVNREGFVNGLLPNGNLTSTIPHTLDYFIEHYGLVLLVLFVLGIIIGIIKNNREIIFLCLPSSIIFAAFYMHYHKIVPRYLMVTDWFTVPVMTYAAGIILTHIFNKSQKLFAKFRINIFTMAVFALSLATVIILLKSPNATSRFVINDAKKLHEDLNTKLPSKAVILCQRPLTGILTCFSHTKPKTLKYLSQFRELKDPAILDSIDRILQSKQNIYVGFRNKEFYNYLARAWNIEDKIIFQAKDYHLEKPLNSTGFEFGILKAWTNLQTTIKMDNIPSDENVILCIDVGLLSRHLRSYANITCNGNLLTKSPQDNLNYFLLNTEWHNGDIVINVESDSILPRHLNAKVIPEKDGIHMSFKNNGIIPFSNIFSDSFVNNPKDKYPNIRHTGSITLPTPSRNQGFYMFNAKVGITSSTNECSLKIYNDKKILFTKEVGSNSELGNGNWHTICVPLPNNILTNNTTKLTWELESQNNDYPENKLLLSSIDIYKIIPAKEFEIRFGQKGDQRAIIRGFHQSEEVSGNRNLHWRWTKHKAQVNIFIKNCGVPAKVTIGYFDEGRPSNTLPLNPIFSFNGTKFIGNVSTSKLENMQYREVTLHIPQDKIDDYKNVLTIESNTWIPSECGINDDSRALGLKLHQIKAIIQKNGSHH